MFVDACAVIAILADEPEAQAYQAALKQARDPFMSSLAAWEVVLVLARPEQMNCSLSQSLRLLLRWLDANGIALRESDKPQDLLSHAVSVAETQGVGKRALSNFDCFHYAHAKTVGAPLLTLDRLLRETDVQTVPADA